MKKKKRTLYFLMIDAYKKIRGFTLMSRSKIGINHVAIGMDTMKVLIKKYYNIKKWKFDKKRFDDKYYEYYYKIFNLKKFHKLDYYISLFHTNGYSVSITLMRDNEFEILRSIDKDNKQKKYDSVLSIKQMKKKSL